MRDGVPMLGSRCVDTRTGVKADCEALKFEVRQGIQYIQAKQTEGAKPSVSDLRSAFRGTLLVGDGTTPGYATDQDLQSLIRDPGQGPTQFAHTLAANRTGLALSTIIRYTKRDTKAKPRKPRRQQFS